MPSRKPPDPPAERMSHEEAHGVLMELWSRLQVDAAKAGSETERAKRMREVEALSLAMTALEAL